MTAFIKAQPVLCISFAAALVSAFFVPPDTAYVGYINYSVLFELFGLMTAVAGLKKAGIFEKLTGFLLSRAGTVRRLAQIFSLLCFFSSMLVTNDVALITFVPLTLLVFSSVDDEKSRIMTVVLETAAANLGSMMTPVGNPQNLYIYDTYGLDAPGFFSALFPYGLISLITITLLTLTIPKNRCRSQSTGESKINTADALIFSGLFVLCLLCVFKLLPAWSCAAAAVVIALFTDRGLLLKADWALLSTFVCFFVLVGNISRIEAVSGFFSGILSGNEITVSALLSQVISNVPAAVMLSGFTENGTALLKGVNIGGLGTPIASMASLISLQFYRSSDKAETGRFLAVFSAVNFGMLILLLAVSYFI